MTIIEKIKRQLKSCNNILVNGYVVTTNNDYNICWLNGFCAEFLAFTNNFQQYLYTSTITTMVNGNMHVETIFLCLTQIVTCIRHLERTINAENSSGTALITSRKHFLDRILWCLQRLQMSLNTLTENVTASAHIPLDEHTFVELMDLILDALCSYSEHKAENLGRDENKNKNTTAILASKKIRSILDLILSHTLAFANVALKSDKKALTALCRKTLSECIAFEEEAANPNHNSSNCKLRATSVDNALNNLETFINEALLRLVYSCFLDIEEISIEKLRNVIRNSEPDDSSVYDLIADFDANIDRITQIGIFAIAFAPDVKTRTIVRSCLASLESLDAYIVPALQNKCSDTRDIHSELLEQHFNEEIVIFRKAIQEIVDSKAFITCYLDMLMQKVHVMEKRFHKHQLQEMIKMGNILYEHFQLEVNRKELNTSKRTEYLEKFILILHECQAILLCSDQVDPIRIIKRFKILISVLNKFRDTFNNCLITTTNPLNRSILIGSNEFGDSHCLLFETIGITPSIRSILYCKEKPMRRNRNTLIRSKQYMQLKHLAPQDGKNLNNLQIENIRRKESLRTALFRRQKMQYPTVEGHSKKNIGSANASES